MKKINFFLPILVLFFSNILHTNPIPSGSALTIVAPTTITLPGNYRLANDIIGTITIQADNVSLDLENKKITAGFNGIVVSGQTEVSIKNGVIESAAATGLFIDDCINVEIVNMDLVGNATGICLLTSTGITVQESTCRNNSDEGIVLNNSVDCVIVENKCFNNLSGIELVNSSLGNTIHQNSCNDNTSRGIFLDTSCNNNTINQNSCNGNGSDGIALSISCNNNTLSENSCNGNTSDGIELFTSCNNNTISKNTCNGNGSNGIGLGFLSNNTVSQNSCNGNGTRGITLSNSDLNTVSKNICDSNTSDGIFIDFSSTDNCVKANITNFNGAEGIDNDGTPNSFFFNKAQQNGGAGTSNYSGVPVAIIATFDLSAGDFTGTTTNLRTGLNISVVP